MPAGRRFEQYRTRQTRICLRKACKTAMPPTRHLQQVRDLRIERTVPVITPAQLLAELPLTDDQAEVVLRGRDQIGAVLDRADARLLVVFVSCSVQDTE